MYICPGIQVTVDGFNNMPLHSSMTPGGSSSDHNVDDAPPPIEKKNSGGKTANSSKAIICCFDGTGNKFGEVRLYLSNCVTLLLTAQISGGTFGRIENSRFSHSRITQNSNVVRLLNALVKDRPDKQVIYYQVRSYQCGTLKTLSLIFYSLGSERTRSSNTTPPLYLILFPKSMSL